MSKQYTVKPGESLRDIAARLYGDATLSAQIDRANLTSTKSTDPDFVAAGTVLNIPDLPEEAALRTGFATARLADKPKDDLTISIDGVEITPVSARVFRAMDAGTSGWSAEIPWTPGENPKLDKVTLPFLYNPASVYIGGNLVVNGLLYSVAPRLGTDGRTKILEGWSFTADAVDSTSKPPYEHLDYTLKQLADEYVSPIGIKAIFNDDAGGAFKEISANTSDTIFEILSRVAAQRGLLVSDDSDGNMIFTKAATGKNVGTLEEGEPGVTGWAAKFDGRRRFNAYRAIGQGPGSTDKSVNSIDSSVPRTRFYSFPANDTLTGDIQAAADWRRSKRLAEALTITLTVTGWIGPDGDIWRENTLVKIVSETLSLAAGHDLLIRSVEYILENNGQTTILSLVPPEVYTGAELIDPWK